MKKRFESKKGFTLIELMVTLAIFTIVSGITLANYPAFGTRMNLELLANDIAYLIRQAQVYGLGIKGVSGVYPAYGVHVGSNSSLVFYDIQNVPRTHTNDDLRYLTNSSNIGTVENYTFHLNETIEQICIGPGNAEPTFSSDDICKDFMGGKQPSLDVAFVKPRPDANECIRDSVSDSSCISPTDSDQTNAKIIIDSSRGHRRMIVVWNTGQIEVVCLTSEVEKCPATQ
jgi:prepilin-type N-terminal cleavage/methylation domain-containing protein